MLFSAKKTPEQDEITTILARLARIEEKIKGIDARVLDLEVSFETLRNKVLRKIQQRNKIEDYEEQEEYTLGQPLFIRGR